MGNDIRLRIGGDWGSARDSIRIGVCGSAIEAFAPITLAGPLRIRLAPHCRHAPGWAPSAVSVRLAAQGAYEDVLRVARVSGKVAGEQVDLLSASAAFG